MKEQGCTSRSHLKATEQSEVTLEIRGWEKNSDGEEVMTKKHILLAEDAEETRKTFATILRKAGYDVTEAKDGSDALRGIIALTKLPIKWIYC